jgi:hypothetical protein
VKELLTYAVILDLLVLAYVHFVIMLMELQKVLGRELKLCVVYHDYQSRIGMHHTKHYRCDSLICFLH